MNASIEEAENQCIRSGAAMVNAQRNFNRAASSPASAMVATTSSPISATGSKPDMDSFAFSLAVGPQMANMFVNWALEEQAIVIKWHYSFAKPDDLHQLHHDIDNILD